MNVSAPARSPGSLEDGRLVSSQREWLCISCIIYKKTAVLEEIASVSSIVLRLRLRHRGCIAAAM